MTIMSAAPARPPWCPHPSWLAYYASIAGNEATVLLHCARCGAGRVLRLEVGT